MSTPRRIYDYLSQAVIVGAIAIMCVGYVRAQSQDAVNARVDEQIKAVDARVGKIEAGLGYGMGALFLNLIAHIFQITMQVQRRRNDEPTVTER